MSEDVIIFYDRPLVWADDKTDELGRRTIKIYNVVEDAEGFDLLLVHNITPGNYNKLWNGKLSLREAIMKAKTVQIIKRHYKKRRIVDEFIEERSSQSLPEDYLPGIESCLAYNKRGEKNVQQ